APTTEPPPARWPNWNRSWPLQKKPRPTSSAPGARRRRGLWLRPATSVTQALARGGSWRRRVVGGGDSDHTAHGAPSTKYGAGRLTPPGSECLRCPSASGVRVPQESPPAAPVVPALTFSRSYFLTAWAGAAASTSPRWARACRARVTIDSV